MKQRVIKFRAWDASTNEMHYPEDRKHDTINVASAHILKYFDCVMQFTGLHDNNGKEIYEGDILAFIPQSDWDKLNYMAYECFYNSDTASFDISRTHCYGSVCGGYVPKITTARELVIIRNIYENPELL